MRRSLWYKKLLVARTRRVERVALNPFDLAQSLIEQCRRGADIDFAAVLRRTLEELGFRYFACCSHVDPLRAPPGAVMLHTYPRRWVQTFHELGLCDVDPVFQYANRTLSPFFWDDTVLRGELSDAQRERFAAASRLGIEHGYTVPIHTPHVRAFRASCSVVPDSRAVAASSYYTVQLVSCFVYEAASRGTNVAEPAPARTLSRRERQCLELAAQGKSDWETSVILGLGERTVHNYIEHAKRRLGVVTRVQAILHALHSGQISFGDVIRGG
jgi:DNA-binding CsgD family transcriptional regulator